MGHELAVGGKAADADVGHGVGQAVDPHFDPHHFQRFCNKKAPKTEVFDAFCRVLTEKMQEQSLVPQGFAGF